MKVAIFVLILFLSFTTFSAADTTLQNITKANVTFVSMDTHDTKDFFNKTKIKPKQLFCRSQCTQKYIFVYHFKQGNKRIWVWTADHNKVSVYNELDSGVRFKAIIKYDEDLQIVDMWDKLSEEGIDNFPVLKEVDWDEVYRRTQESIDANR